MGKVYDALRKAEAERIQRPPPAPAPAFDRGSAGTGSATPRVRRIAEFLTGSRWSRAVPADEGASSINKRRIALLHPNSFVTEQFRTLRARLDSLSAERPLRTLVVTSPLPGEGKTTAAVNLGIVSSMAVGRRVLLVDCDLRHPRIHTTLGLRPEFGLAEVLTGQVPAERAILKVEGCELSVLPVRGAPDNPSELLASTRMVSLLEELASRYDQILLDTPPTLALPDAKSLSEIADGVLLVVKADETPADDVEAALDVLDRRRVMGVVLNGTVNDAERYGY
jgi:capsular exopolysaccharide synthesis family protein